MQRTSSPKLAVGLSGGVDSAAAALLLKERGYDLLGVTMTLGRSCDVGAVAAAEAVARQLAIPFEVVDLAREFSAKVLDYVRAEYMAARTPNPCVRCNEALKLSLLPRFAFENLSCGGFATGHYARVVDGSLYRGVDRAKDQSYFLYRVDRSTLLRTHFPLGAHTKSEAREIVRRAGITLPDATESQDFCWGDVRTLLPRSAAEGEVVTTDGKVVGRHSGYWNFTVGMRKGLGTGGGGVPFYVVALDAANNRVIVGPRSAAFKREFSVADVVRLAEWDEIEDAGSARRLMVKVRSSGELCGPVRLAADGSVASEVPVNAVAPGQSAVFYDGDRVLAGGIIQSSTSID